MTKFDSSSTKEGSVDPPAAAAAHVFLQTLNPMRGKMEWKPKPVDYDYKQEVARAAFADMLHEHESARPPQMRMTSGRPKQSFKAVWYKCAPSTFPTGHIPEEASKTWQGNAQCHQKSVL